MWVYFCNGTQLIMCLNVYLLFIVRMFD
jgi:hypothetical protein